MVSSRSRNAWPPSACLVALTICGTRTAFSRPPAIRLYSWFGTVLAVANVSAASAPADPEQAGQQLRPGRSPSSRETNVPDAITVVERIRLESLIRHSCLSRAAGGRRVLGVVEAVAQAGPAPRPAQRADQADQHDEADDHAADR